MNWAYKRLKELGFSPVPKYKTNPYDFLCNVSGVDLYVEVKRTQQNGRCISLTPNEVTHAREHRNSALFIVYGVDVKGKRSPKISGGKELFIRQWDIDSGQLEPRGFAFTLPESVFESKQGASNPGKTAFLGKAAEDEHVAKRKVAASRQATRYW